MSMSLGSKDMALVIAKQRLRLIIGLSIVAWLSSLPYGFIPFGSGHGVLGFDMLSVLCVLGLLLAMCPSLLTSSDLRALIHACTAGRVQSRRDVLSLAPLATLLALEALPDEAHAASTAPSKWAGKWNDPESPGCRREIVMSFDGTKGRLMGSESTGMNPGTGGCEKDSKCLCFCSLGGMAVNTCWFLFLLLLSSCKPSA